MIWRKRLKDLKTNISPSVTDDDLREALARYAHEAWSGWMVWMFEKCEIYFVDPGENNVQINMPYTLYERWQRQITTHYADLSEQEKDSDRAEADRMLEIIG